MKLQPLATALVTAWMFVLPGENFAAPAFQETPGAEALAANPGDSTKAPWEAPGATNLNLFGTLFKTLGLILAMTVLLYLGLRVYKNGVQGAPNIQAASVELLGTSAIGPGKSLSVVQVLEHLLVLGVAGDNITVVLDVPVDDLSEDTRKNLFSQKGMVPHGSFKQTLSNLMRQPR